MMTTGLFVSCHHYQSIEELHITSIDDDGINSIEKNIAIRLSCDTMDIVKTLLLRPTIEQAGLYAYHNPSNTLDCPNIRATRLAMACGLFHIRLYGHVVLLRQLGNGKVIDLGLDEVYSALETSPDLRSIIQNEATTDSKVQLPDWLKDASMKNYHDGNVLEKLAQVMATTAVDDYDDDSSSSDFSSPRENNKEPIIKKEASAIEPTLTLVPLCLHCRRPAITLCSGCQGAYFCDLPRECRKECWSHECICLTWRRYTHRRTELSAFTGLDSWCDELTSRPMQLSEQPYIEFLQKIGINMSHASDDEIKPSWWKTEMSGWSGGQSESAKGIDITIRRTYKQGFAPLTDIPVESAPELDTEFVNAHNKNAIGLYKLQNWSDYYRLRHIPKSSPIALLLTFPLTLYHAIVEYGEVPCTVATMMKRPLRIHIVGAEKELNFLDSFKEVVFLLRMQSTDSHSIELVFIIRQDMLPQSLINCKDWKCSITDGLDIHVVTGTYNDSIDPNFDCGSGPPDMIVAFNAGLFAYKSWRSVISYLYHNKSTVGVFTDYNEHSAVQCASLGGSNARESVCVNPFRQPRSMPVYSMNLPQFCNGFLYVYNQQELEE